MALPNSQYLKWFKEIESELWSFFRLFEDICGQCYNYTINQAEGHAGRDISNWCCCLTDNQLHDNWDCLNPLQKTIDSKWYEKLKGKGVELGRCRMPNNGPCPALGRQGCLLGHFRTISCTTQICGKMMEMMKRLKVIDNYKRAPLQIEDIIPLPVILPILYGIKPGKVDESQVKEYLRSLRDLKKKMKAIDQKERKKIVDEVMADYLN